MKLTVNGLEVDVDDRHAKTPLLWVLREVLDMPGTKFGCGAGFCAACTVLAQQVTVDARAHAERLTPNVLAALADAALAMTDLDAVVVGCGPGPFTGLRAGMASAAAGIRGTLSM